MLSDVWMSYYIYDRTNCMSLQHRLHWPAVSLCCWGFSVNKVLVTPESWSSEMKLRLIFSQNSVEDGERGVLWKCWTVPLMNVCVREGTSLSSLYITSTDSVFCASVCHHCTALQTKCACQCMTPVTTNNRTRSAECVCITCFLQHLTLRLFHSIFDKMTRNLCLDLIPRADVDLLGSNTVLRAVYLVVH